MAAIKDLKETKPRAEVYLRALKKSLETLLKNPNLIIEKNYNN